VFVRGALLAGALLLLVLVALVVFAAPIADRVFSGKEALVLALFVGLLGLAAEHLTRGAFAGIQAFSRYGWQLGIDGSVRLVASGFLALMGVRTVGWYGFALAAAPVTAVLLTAWRLGAATEPSPREAPWGDLARSVGTIMAGTALAQFVVNAAPVAASVLAGRQEAARAGVFISVLVLARIPLFLFAAVQAAFLPGLAALVAEGDGPGFRRRLNAVMAFVVALGAAGLVVFIAVGPWLVELFYGPAYQTTRTDMWPLAAGAGLYMIAAALTQALVALRAYAMSIIGWALGTLSFFAAIIVPIRLEQRVGMAFLAATLVAAVTSLVTLRRRMSRPLSDPIDAVPLPPPS
jgi:O-antigen/teichoic acid export membrane protein